MVVAAVAVSGAVGDIALHKETRCENHVRPTLNNDRLTHLGRKDGGHVRDGHHLHLVGANEANPLAQGAHLGGVRMGSQVRGEVRGGRRSEDGEPEGGGAKVRGVRGWGA